MLWGRLDAAIFGHKTVELWGKRKRLEAELAAVEPPDVISPHSGILADYERKLERLQAAIEQDIKDGDPEYTRAIRDLVECVTVEHDAAAPDNVHIEITARLNSRLGDNAFPNRVGENK